MATSPMKETAHRALNAIKNTKRARMVLICSILVGFGVAGFRFLSIILAFQQISKEKFCISHFFYSSADNPSSFSVNLVVKNVTCPMKLSFSNISGSITSGEHSRPLLDFMVKDIQLEKKAPVSAVAVICIKIHHMSLDDLLMLVGGKVSIHLNFDVSGRFCLFRFGIGDLHFQHAVDLPVPDSVDGGLKRPGSFADMLRMEVVDQGGGVPGRGTGRLSEELKEIGYETEEFFKTGALKPIERPLVVETRLDSVMLRRYLRENCAALSECEFDCTVHSRIVWEVDFFYLQRIELGVLDMRGDGPILLRLVLMRNAGGIRSVIVESLRKKNPRAGAGALKSQAADSSAWTVALTDLRVAQDIDATIALRNERLRAALPILRQLIGETALCCYVVSPYGALCKMLLSLPGDGEEVRVKITQVTDILSRRPDVLLNFESAMLVFYSPHGLFSLLNGITVHADSSGTVAVRYGELCVLREARVGQSIRRGVSFMHELCVLDDESLSIISSLSPGTRGSFPISSFMQHLPAAGTGSTAIVTADSNSFSFEQKLLCTLRADALEWRVYLSGSVVPTRSLTEKYGEAVLGLRYSSTLAAAAGEFFSDVAECFAGNVHLVSVLSLPVGADPSAVIAAFRKGSYTLIPNVFGLPAQDGLPPVERDKVFMRFSSSGSRAEDPGTAGPFSPQLVQHNLAYDISDDFRSMRVTIEPSHSTDLPSPVPALVHQFYIDKLSFDIDKLSATNDKHSANSDMPPLVHALLGPAYVSPQRLVHAEVLGPLVELEMADGATLAKIRIGDMRLEGHDVVGLVSEEWYIRSDCGLLNRVIEFVHGRRQSKTPLFLAGSHVNFDMQLQAAEEQAMGGSVTLNIPQGVFHLLPDWLTLGATRLSSVLSSDKLFELSLSCAYQEHPAYLNPIIESRVEPEEFNTVVNNTDLIIQHIRKLSKKGDNFQKFFYLPDMNNNSVSNISNNNVGNTNNNNVGNGSVSDINTTKTPINAPMNTPINTFINTPINMMKQLLIRNIIIEFKIHINFKTLIEKIAESINEIKNNPEQLEQIIDRAFAYDNNKAILVHSMNGSAQRKTEFMLTDILCGLIRLLGKHEWILRMEVIKKGVLGEMDPRDWRNITIKPPSDGSSRLKTAMKRCMSLLHVLKADDTLSGKKRNLYGMSNEEMKKHVAELPVLNVLPYSVEVRGNSLFIDVAVMSDVITELLEAITASIPPLFAVNPERINFKAECFLHNAVIIQNKKGRVLSIDDVSFEIDQVIYINHNNINNNSSNHVNNHVNNSINNNSSNHVNNSNINNNGNISNIIPHHFSTFTKVDDNFMFVHNLCDSTTNSFTSTPNNNNKFKGIKSIIAGYEKHKRTMTSSKVDKDLLKVECNNPHTNGFLGSILKQRNTVETVTVGDIKVTGPKPSKDVLFEMVGDMKVFPNEGLIFNRAMDRWAKVHLLNWLELRPTTDSVTNALDDSKVSNALYNAKVKSTFDNAMINFILNSGSGTVKPSSSTAIMTEDNIVSLIGPSGLYQLTSFYALKEKEPSLDVPIRIKLRVNFTEDHKNLITGINDFTGPPEFDAVKYAGQSFMRLKDHVLHIVRLRQLDHMHRQLFNASFDPAKYYFSEPMCTPNILSLRFNSVENTVLLDLVLPFRISILDGSVSLAFICNSNIMGVVRLAGSLYDSDAGGYSISVPISLRVCELSFKEKKGREYRNGQDFVAVKRSGRHFFLLGRCNMPVIPEQSLMKDIAVYLSSFKSAVGLGFPYVLSLLWWRKDIDPKKLKGGPTRNFEDFRGVTEEAARKVDAALGVLQTSGSGAKRDFLRPISRSRSAGREQLAASEREQLTTSEKEQALQALRLRPSRSQALSMGLPHWHILHITSERAVSLYFATAFANNPAHVFVEMAREFYDVEQCHGWFNDNATVRSLCDMGMKVFRGAAKGVGYVASSARTVVDTSKGAYKGAKELCDKIVEKTPQPVKDVIVGVGHRLKQAASYVSGKASSMLSSLRGYI